MGKVKAHLIMEIMGRPAKHIEEALNTLVMKLGAENGVKLLEKKYHAPKPIEEKKDIFVTFGEINVEFDTLEHFFATIIGYMPSNVEVYEPDKFKLDSAAINSLGNHLVSKLHRYDEIVKRVVIERDILLRQLQELKPGFKIEDLFKGETALKREESGKKKKKSIKKSSSLKKK